MHGLLHVRVPLLARRLVTLIPALIIFSMVQRSIVAGLTFGAVKE